ncbi:MAG: DUF3857 domain-containing protein [Paracoccaceae bacterium]
MWLLRIVILVLTLPMAAAAALAGEFERADIPGWVEDLPVPEADPSLITAARDGVFFLLADDQVRWEGEVRQRFSRVVSQVIDRAGLEATAAISRDFDPSFETLVLTRLDVVRDGQVISYGKDLKAEILRRESRLDAGIIDGTLTVHLQVPDLRVGDIVDASFVTLREPLLDGATRVAGNWLEYSVPVSQSRFLVHWPDGWPLNMEAPPERVLFSQEPEQGGQRLEWQRLDHIPPHAEEMVPPEYKTDAAVTISGWQDWRPLSAALSPYYTQDYPLTPEWEARLAAIRESEQDDAARAIAALRLVQAEIRYVGLEVGAGGYFARKPATVITSGFGDCKDKSLLLRTVLARLGIASSVALTDLKLGYGLASRVPGIGAFDHMILRAELGGESYWMDPTGSYEGGTLASATQPDYGYALPLAGPEAAELVKMVTDDTPRREIVMHENYAFGPSFVILTVQSTYRGSAANAQRYYWATRPAEEISRNYLEYYSRRYPGLEQLGTASFVEDRVENSVRVTETYRMSSRMLQDEALMADFVFAADDLSKEFPRTQIGPRQTPLMIGPPRSYRHTIRVTGAPINFRPPKPQTLANPGFTISFNGTANDYGQMDLSWEYVTKNRLAAPEDAQEIIRQARQISDLVWLSWDLRPEIETPGN